MAAQLMLPGLATRRTKTAMKEEVRGRLEVARARRLLHTAERKRRRAARMVGELVDVGQVAMDQLVLVIGWEKAEQLVAAARGGR
jgi:hypothetical protein